MKVTTQQAIRRNSGPLALGLGLLLIAVFCLLAAAPGATQPADDTMREDRRVDPWNKPAGRAQQGVRREPAQPSLRPTSPRHIEYLQAGVPVEYRSQRNRYPNVPKAIDAGREVYRANFIACHGPKGRGDGDAGLDLFPSPALLTELTEEQGAADEYLLWSIAEGGTPFGTAMPAFKSRLNENQIWQVISYLRAGLPAQQ